MAHEISLEQKHVHQVYDSIAREFSHTRGPETIWPEVKRFIESLEKWSLVADVGCGNGKYFHLRDDVTMVGCDMCRGLLECCDADGGTSADVLLANGLSLPYRDQSCDAVMSIAVLHHLSTFDLRRQFLAEMVRVARHTVFFSVWNTSAIKKKWKKMDSGNGTDGGGGEGGDYLVPWMGKCDRYYHIFTLEDLTAHLDGYNYTVTEEWGNWYVTISV